MESTEELQRQEITALKSIYGDDFQEAPAPRAWKVCSCSYPHFLVALHQPRTIGCCETPRIHDQDYTPRRYQWDQVLSFPNGHVGDKQSEVTYIGNADRVSVFPRHTLRRLLQFSPLRTLMACFWKKSMPFHAPCNTRRRKTKDQRWYSRYVNRLSFIPYLTEYRLPPWPKNGLPKTSSFPLRAHFDTRWRNETSRRSRLLFYPPRPFTVH